MMMQSSRVNRGVYICGRDCVCRHQGGIERIGRPSSDLRQPFNGLRSRLLGDVHAVSRAVNSGGRVRYTGVCSRRLKGEAP